MAFGKLGAMGARGGFGSLGGSGGSSTPAPAPGTTGQPIGLLLALTKAS